MGKPRGCLILVVALLGLAYGAETGSEAFPSFKEGKGLEVFALESPFKNDESSPIRFWQLGGLAIVSADEATGQDVLRLTNAKASERGLAYNQLPLLTTEFDAYFDFAIKTEQRNLNADGMAFFMLKNEPKEGPVYGLQDDWDGLVLALDTYSNSRTTRVPYLYAMTNDGTQKLWKPATDGTDRQLTKGCYVNLKFDGRIFIRLEKGELKVGIGSPKHKSSRPCFTATGVDLDFSKGVHAGFTAETGHFYSEHVVQRFQVKAIGQYPDVEAEEVEYEIEDGLSPRDAYIEIHQRESEDEEFDESYDDYDDEDYDDEDYDYDEYDYDDYDYDDDDYDEDDEEGRHHEKKDDDSHAHPHHKKVDDDDTNKEDARAHPHTHTHHHHHHHHRAHKVDDDGNVEPELMKDSETGGRVPYHHGTRRHHGEKHADAVEGKFHQLKMDMMHLLKTSGPDPDKFADALKEVKEDMGLLMEIIDEADVSFTDAQDIAKDLPAKAKSLVEKVTMLTTSVNKLQTDLYRVERSCQDVEVLLSHVDRDVTTSSELIRQQLSGFGASFWIFLLLSQSLVGLVGVFIFQQEKEKGGMLKGGRRTFGRLV